MPYIIFLGFIFCLLSLLWVLISIAKNNFSWLALLILIFSGWLVVVGFIFYIATPPDSMPPDTSFTPPTKETIEQKGPPEKEVEEAPTTVDTPLTKKEIIEMVESYYDDKIRIKRWGCP